MRFLSFEDLRVIGSVTATSMEEVTTTLEYDTALVVSTLGIMRMHVPA
jgi:hypothetical protein